MFIETHSTENDNVALTFIKSTNVQVYPCGRRRSTFIADNSSTSGAAEGHIIPFDPEARLNTEANNRKYSSLNGYKQTYIKEWDNNKKLLTIALKGYLFTITLAGNYNNCTTFGNKIVDLDPTCILYRNALEAAINTQDPDLDAIAAARDALNDYIESVDRIYANILIEDVHLFSGGFQEYFTGILQAQAIVDVSEDALDLLNSETRSRGSIEEKKDFDNYYFSGLSFSTTPLTGTEDRKHWASLCILDGKYGSWQVHERSYLPLVEHGDTANSIEVDDTKVRKTLTVIGNEHVHAGLFVGKEGDENDNYKVSINNGDIIASNGITTPNLGVTALAGIKKAEIENAVITNATITEKATINTIDVTNEVSAPTLIQVLPPVEPGDTDTRKPVPIIDVVQDGDLWQLQISRVSLIPKPTSSVPDTEE